MARVNRTGTQLRTRTLRGRSRAVAARAEKNSRYGASRNTPRDVRSAISYTPQAGRPGTPSHAQAEPATERRAARRGTRRSRKGRPRIPQRYAVTIATAMMSAGPARPDASTARTGVAVVYTPPSTIETNRPTCPGHAGATVAE